MTEIAQLQRKAVDRMQVRIEHLDKLLTLAGEVIITSSNLQDLERRVQESVSQRRALAEESLNVVKTSNEASRRISQDLHDLVMAIRLVEIGDTFRLFRRPIRDLARNLGRDIDLVFEGSDTMIDKALAERLVDPLLHLLRNAVDHGIEPPLERTRVEKAARGRVVIAAVDREHHTEITVSDDGRGIDDDAVRAAAQAAGLAERIGAGASMLDILCHPGFSMAAAVTATSGRGVGLDIVRSAVSDFDGRIHLHTEVGTGTRFILEIPKLRAVNIIDALTLRAGTGLFALPIDQVVASLGIDPRQIQRALNRARYFTYQGQVIVLHDLLQLLGNAPLEDDLNPLPVVIVQSKGRKIALAVSEFLGPQKLVNMPLQEDLPHDRGVAGTAVFTGGRLGLTLDVDELVAAAGGGATETRGRRQVAEETAPQGPPEREALGGPVEAEARQAPEPPPAAEPSALKAEDAGELVAELRRTLQKLQDALLSLEAEPHRVELLNEAFRRLHAIKGNFTMLEVDAVADFAHHLETVLDFLRGERLSLTTERMDLLLDSVAYLIQAGDRIPREAPDPPEALLAKLKEETATTLQPDQGASAAELLGRTFELSPTVQLQVLSALKRGEHTYETFISFDPGRQAEFLTAYLVLRRIGMHGSVLSTLPKVGEIEQGRCGTAFKVLWSTPLDETGLNELFDTLARQYNLTEHSSIPTTIFRYERE